jgi:hypothetical protein
MGRSVACYWLLVVGFWLLVTGYWLLVTGHPAGYICISRLPQSKKPATSN